MPKIIVTHSVIDVDNWLKGKSERADAIAAMGGSNVVATWPTMEASPSR